MGKKKYRWVIIPGVRFKTVVNMIDKKQSGFNVVIAIISVVVVVALIGLDDKYIANPISMPTASTLIVQTRTTWQ